tara:strand:- start:321 stop:572 length:252 start_codon:yes stop_codon:yes gene_type:complete
MNTRLLKEYWRKYYKRGFLTGLTILSFLCVVDQTLHHPFFFNKISELNTLMFALSFILFGGVFCGIISLLILLIISLTTISKK